MSARQWIITEQQLLQPTQKDGHMKQRRQSEMKREQSCRNHESNRAGIRHHIVTHLLPSKTNKERKSTPDSVYALVWINTKDQFYSIPFHLYYANKRSLRSHPVAQIRLHSRNFCYHTCEPIRRWGKTLGFTEPKVTKRIRYNLMCDLVLYLDDKPWQNRILQTPINLEHLAWTTVQDPSSALKCA